MKLSTCCGWWRRPRAPRGFAFAVPALLFVAYFATVAFIDTLAWSVPFWAGAIGLAGAAGWSRSYLPLPPDRAARAAAAWR